MNDFKFSFLGLFATWALITGSGIYVWAEVKNGLVAQCGANTIATCTATDPCSSNMHDSARNAGVALTLLSSAFFLYLVFAMQSFRSNADMSRKRVRSAPWVMGGLGVLILVAAALMLIFILNDIKPYDTASPLDPGLRICSSREFTLFKWIGWWATGFAVVFLYFACYASRILAAHFGSGLGFYNNLPMTQQQQPFDSQYPAYIGRENNDGTIEVPLDSAVAAFREQGGRVISQHRSLGSDGSHFVRLSTNSPSGIDHTTLVPNSYY